MITVLGASGFIGSRLAKTVAARGIECLSCGRSTALPEGDLGNVIYCIGLTSDFRSKPFETVEAHVCRLLELLRNGRFTSLLYVSSTRLYDGGRPVAKEEDAIRSAPLEPVALYNISKLMGESLAFASGKQVRVARLSNVYGDDFTSNNFLSAIIKEALSHNEVTIHTAATSGKDYVSINDAVHGLLDVATGGRHELYNIASGMNISTGILAEKIGELTGAKLKFQGATAPVESPRISIERMQNEFNFKPARLMDELEGLVASYRRNRALWDT